MPSTPLLLILLAGTSTLLSSCWLPSTAEYQARKNRPAASPEPPPFELKETDRPFHVPPSQNAPRSPEVSQGTSQAARIPGGGIGTLPRQTSLASSQPSLRASPGAGLRERLRTTSVRFSLEDTESLREAVDLLATVSGLPFVVHPLAVEAALDAGAEFALSLSNPIPAGSALELIVELAGDDVGWTVRDGIVLVTTAEKARGATVLASYDVRALTFGVTDFIAPRIDRLSVSGDDNEERFARAGETHRGIDTERVVQLIEDHVAPGTWDDEGTSLDAENGVLFVRHSPEVQREVRRFLRRLGG